MIKYIDDIQNVVITKDDSFLIDANILVLLHSNELSEAEKNVAPAYSNFVGWLRSIGCTLYVSALNIQEVFHVTERLYFNLYRSTNKNCKRKEYRRIAAERNLLANVQRNIWAQIQEFYEIIETPIATTELGAFVESYESHYYEPVDFFISQHIPTKNIITQDTDFDDASELNVFRISNS